MKKIKIINIVIFLLFISALNIYGQRKEITQSEFSALHQKAAQKSDKLSRRLISEGLTYENDGETIREIKKEINEIESPERMRFFSETQNLLLNKSFSLEIIKYDGFKYHRENNSNWKKEKIAETKSKDKTEPKIKRKYFIKEHFRAEVKTAYMLESEEEFKTQVMDYKTKAISEYLVLRRIKYWIDKDDLILQSNMSIENSETNKIILCQSWLYEYDSTIKVEAPMISEEAKH